MSRSGFNSNNLRHLFIIEVARKYFEETSIHGLKYITEPNRTLVERVCWVIFITVSCSVAGYLIYSVCGNLCRLQNAMGRVDLLIQNWFYKKSKGT